jgi:hypothetical protein
MKEIHLKSYFFLLGTNQYPNICLNLYGKWMDNISIIYPLDERQYVVPFDWFVKSEILCLQLSDDRHERVPRTIWR